MSDNYQVELVSGTYNRLQLLQRMIASARKSVGRLRYRFILVDGGSTDGTIDWCKEQDDILLIEQGELLGAIKAYNAGCEAATGEYVVILNDDITVNGNSIVQGYNFMESHPECGQGAFGHVYQRRGDKAKSEVRWQGAYGYLYGQCSIIRRELGELVGWWGTGYRTYAGDTQLSLRLWECGWSVLRVVEASVTDYEFEDELRVVNGKGASNVHPDTIAFQQRWKGRLPAVRDWIPAGYNRIWGKAARGTLKTVRFKITPPNWPERTALINVFKKYGEATQINQSDYSRKNGHAALQKYAIDWVHRNKPDLILLQSHVPKNAVLPETARTMKRLCPDAVIVNWNGDCHFPLSDFDISIARSVDLHLHISPTLYPEYLERGVGNVGYWPIGVETEFFEAERATNWTSQGPGPDVIFLGALYGIGVFPEAKTRREAVHRLWTDDEVSLKVYGPGWHQIGINTHPTWDRFLENAEAYANSAMALSISQASHLWGYTSDRLYNICASGCPALVQKFEGMEEHGFVDGETCIAWDGLNNMMDQVRYYLKPENVDHRERIAIAGRQLIKDKHTWDHRVPVLFDMIGGLQCR